MNKICIPLDLLLRCKVKFPFLEIINDNQHRHNCRNYCTFWFNVRKAAESSNMFGLSGSKLCHNLPYYRKKVGKLSGYIHGHHHHHQQHHNFHLDHHYNDDHDDLHYQHHDYQYHHQGKVFITRKKHSLPEKSITREKHVHELAVSRPRAQLLDFGKFCLEFFCQPKILPA